MSLPRERGGLSCRGAQEGNVSSLLWLLLLPVTLPQILIPALMVTAEKDPVLVPEMSKHMEDWVRERSCPGGHQRFPAEGTGVEEERWQVWTQSGDPLEPLA